MMAFFLFSCIIPPFAQGAASDPCAPGFVYKEGSSQAVPAGYQPAGTAEGVITLRRFGHSSFLLTSPSEANIVMDPHRLFPSPIIPDAVTISNEHFTHNQASILKGNPIILRGITHEGTWNKIETMVKDVSIFNVPSYENSIFVFRVGGFCIAHLGNLRHILTEEQLKQIGQPDIIMIPVDAGWTLSHEDVATVIAQLKPVMVIPMHYDLQDHVDIFIAFIKKKYPVRTVKEDALTLVKAMLPAGTEVVVLNYK
ncbi:MAG: MBL fold metallo-hydrolase [Candidatus Tectomicrobia bacterium]|nr:MBL fold metallo-hydrolase [Candidatus Tectomicrobia bacterium]